MAQQNTDVQVRVNADYSTLTKRVATVVGQEVARFLDVLGFNDQPMDRDSSAESGDDDFSYPVPKNWPFNEPDKNEKVLQPINI